MVCTFFLKNNWLKFALLSPRSLSSPEVHASDLLSLGSLTLSLSSVKLQRPHLQTELLQVQLRFFSSHTKSSEWSSAVSNR
jgi:hypothetical protein